MQKNIRSRGFTLIELLVVVAILVALAGLVLPRLDRVVTKSQKGISAGGMQSVSRYIQVYHTLKNAYPDGWDSLLDTTGSLWSNSDPKVKQLDPELTGVGGFPNQHTKLKVATQVLNSDQLRSIGRIGLITMFDVDTTQPIGFPGDAFSTPRLFATLGTTGKYATLNSQYNGFDPTPAASADDDADAIVQHYYAANGGTSPSDTALIVLGFGPRNTAIGDVVQETPFYSNTQAVTYYNRYLCIFEAYSSGSRAQLKGVVGSDADQVDGELEEYYTEE